MAEDTPNPEVETEAADATDAEPQHQPVRAAGLEDYGFWSQTLRDAPRPEATPPFRRGRIWA